jgi:8-oxo-dGTP pyrophosphatase MutT (NUDIX family)
MESRGFQVIAEEELLWTPTIQIKRAKVATPSSSEVERLVVRHSGAVVVVPVDGGDVILVRQYRAAVDRWLIEAPAGKRDIDGEDPETTAIRELEEEAGMVASRIELLARFYNSPGFSDEYTYCYLAEGLSPVPTIPHGPEEEHMEVVRMPLGVAISAIWSGEIEDAKTQIGLLLAERRLAER